MLGGGTTKTTQDSKEDCTMCRIIGGAGLLGASWYVFTGVRHQHPKARGPVFLFAGGLGYIGLARLAQWPPFDRKVNSV